MENEQIEQSKVAGDPPQQEVAASSRRRLLRAGLKATPIVVATLASRPSLACHCIVPSAWGSINTALDKVQDMGDQELKDNLRKGGSLARYEKAIYWDFNPFYFSAFLTENGDGWIALAKKITNYPPKLFDGCDKRDVDERNRRKRRHLQGQSVVQAVALQKVSDLCAKMGCVIPKDCGEMAALTLVSQKGFGASVLVAQINMFLGRYSTSCFTKEMINEMASGSYQPKNLPETWGTKEISDYLHNNYLARRYG